MKRELYFVPPSLDWIEWQRNRKVHTTPGTFCSIGSTSNLNVPTQIFRGILPYPGIGAEGE